MINSNTDRSAGRIRIHAQNLRRTHLCVEGGVEPGLAQQFVDISIDDGIAILATQPVPSSTMAIGEAGSAVNKPDEGVSSHLSKLRGTATGVSKIPEPSPAALPSQIVVLSGCRRS